MKLGRVLINLVAPTLAAGALACTAPVDTNPGLSEDPLQKKMDLEKAKQERIMVEQERRQELPGEF